MKGIVRPCRHHLGPELHERWQAHLCGLCLTLRDVAGQAERVLTGYDVLLLSVLVEAQAGSVETTSAAPCPLRGFTSATVVRSDTGAARLAAAGALLSAGAGLADKVGDEDLPRAARPAGRRLAARLARRGSALAERVGLDPAAVLAAPGRAARAERTPAPRLDDLLAPTGDAVGALFAQTAVVAGCPGNGEALAAAGQAFGRLVHLLDAVDDHAQDARSGAFNPLTATGTEPGAARALADRLVADLAAALARAALADRSLVDVLLGTEVRAAVHRALPPVSPPEEAPVPLPEQRGGTGAWAATVAALTLLVPAVFVGGSYGGGCGGGRRHRGFGGYPRGGGGYPPSGYDVYGYPPPRRRGHPPPQYGYRTVGPSCGQLLACNCCANLACNACCCGSSCSQ